MQAQRIRTLVQLPDHHHAWRWLESPRGRIGLDVARAAGELLLATATAMIVGHLAGVLFGVEHPADPRTPGGPTETDLEAFVALGAILVGLVVSGWRMVLGSMIVFGGALAFWAAIPELDQMAFLLGALGGANLAAWLVNRIKERQHNDYGERTGPPPKRGQDRPVTHHPVGLF